jgi:hypothetical protein
MAMNDKNNEIIRIVKELLEIRRQQPNRMDRAGTKIVKSGLRRLKELGLSNKEIYEALGGAWSEVAIKQMTAGIGAKDTEARRSFGQVLNEIATSDYTSDDLDRLLPIVRSRLDSNLAMEFLEDTLQSRRDPGETLSLYEKMKDNGMDPTIVAKVNETTEVLSSCGYTMGTLEKFKEASKDYDPDELLQSISVQRGIDKMKIAEQKQLQRQVEVDRQLGVKTTELRKVEEKKKMLEVPIKKWEYLHSIGYTDDLLDLLIKTTKQFGRPNDVLEGINTYGNIGKMEEKLLGLQRQTIDQESKLKKVQADNAHFKAQLVLSDALLGMGLSVIAIAKLTEMARTLGLPESVFAAIISYGSVANLEKRKGVLESLIAELEKRHGALQVMVDKANKEHVEVQKMNETHLDVIRLAKVILLVSFSPKQNVEFGLKYAILCLSACRNICRGIDVKKTVKVREILGNKYPNYSFAEFEVQDLLHMALTALFICDSQEAAA